MDFHDSKLSCFGGYTLQLTDKNLTNTENTVSGDMAFLGDSASFHGHFENYPVLPGVIQLHFITKFINLFFHKNFKAYDIVKLKFSSLILPDTLVHFELNKLNDNEFTFACENENCKYSAGKIVIKE